MLQLFPKVPSIYLIALREKQIKDKLRPARVTYLAKIV